LSAKKHIVGLTGGIGSGKTTVAKIFEQYQIPVFYADNAAKYLMQHQPELKQQITALFGQQAYTNNQLNRKFIAAQVFDNKEKLASLNALVHPAVAHYFTQWVNAQESKVVLKEAAILIESGSYKDCDEIIVVTAPEPLRLQRIAKRDHISQNEIKQRMQHQLSDKERLQYAHHHIINDEQHSLLLQCDKIVNHWRYILHI
jgi:dephospho-CoA kinase